MGVSYLLGGVVKFFPEKVMYVVPLLAAALLLNFLSLDEWFSFF